MIEKQNVGRVMCLGQLHAGVLRRSNTDVPPERKEYDAIVFQKRKPGHVLARAVIDHHQTADLCKRGRDQFGKTNRVRIERDDDREDAAFTGLPRRKTVRRWLARWIFGHHARVNERTVFRMSSARFLYV
ncbi:UNVERIFIED_ORG: hypothetical protein ABIC72_000958 [Burkholderia sp. 1988]|nr:hypothetical protein [Paraburkholderia terricola]